MNGLAGIERQRLDDRISALTDLVERGLRALAPLAALPTAGSDYSAEWFIRGTDGVLRPVTAQQAVAAHQAGKEVYTRNVSQLRKVER